MEKINIIPFGSGSTGNSIYIEIGKYKILVDMGIGYRMINQSLLKYDRKIEAEIEMVWSEIADLYAESGEWTEEEEEKPDERPIRPVK